MPTNRNRIYVENRASELGLVLFPGSAATAEEVAQRRAEVAWELAELGMDELNAVSTLVRVLKEMRKDGY